MKFLLIFRDILLQCPYFAYKYALIIIHMKIFIFLFRNWEWVDTKNIRKSWITNQKYFLFELPLKHLAFLLSHTIRFIIPFRYCQLYLSRSNTAEEAEKVYFIHSTLLWILWLQHWRITLSVGGDGKNKKTKLFPDKTYKLQQEK